MMMNPTSPMVYSTVGGERNKHPHYLIKTVRGLSYTIIALGCLVFIIQIVDICLKSRASVVGAGMWAGAFFILTGAFGVQSTKKRTTCLIVVFLVLSTIGAILSIAPITASSIQWAHGNYRHSYRDYYYYARDGGWTSGDSPEFREKMRASIGMNVIIVIASVVNGIMLIVSAAFACHGLCPDSSNKQVMLVAGQVQYIAGPDGQSQMVIIPVSQPVPGGSHVPASTIPSTMVAGQPLGITNPTSAGETGQAMAPITAGGPPAYSELGASPPGYETKVPLPD